MESGKANDVFYFKARINKKNNVIDEEDEEMEHIKPNKMAKGDDTIMEDKNERSFQIGNAKAETHGQKRRRLRRRNRERKKHKALLTLHKIMGRNTTSRKAKRHRRNKEENVLSEYEIRMLSWRVIPNYACPSIRSYFMVDTLEGDSYLTKVAALEKYLEPSIPCPFLSEYRAPSSTICIDICVMFEESRELLHKNQKIRWILKRFITKWRLKRHKVVNEYDVVTMSPIQKPVYIHSFKGNCKYVFEAESVVRDIHKKLVHNEGEFPSPIYPKNMLTNESLTKAQLSSVISQCRAHGKTTWAIESFLNLELNMAKFLTFNRKQLRVCALKSVLQDPKGCDYYEMLFDFIISQHEVNNKRADTELYSWALKNIPDEPILLKWRDICKKWYENDILIDDPFEKTYQFHLVTTDTLPLCQKPITMIKKFRKSNIGQSNSA